MAEHIIAEAILSFASGIFSKGGEEFGKNMAKDLYEKLKKVFKEEDQREILDTLKNSPNVLSVREELNSEVIRLLQENESFPKEIVRVFELMQVDIAILQVTYRSYAYVRYQHEQENIKYNLSAADNEEDCLHRIQGYERKMRTLGDKIKKLVVGNLATSGR